MINIIDKITKETDAKIVSKLIIDTEMDERIEKLNEETKILVKSIIYMTRAFCDKGLKSKATMLAQEYFAQEDLDGNGKIYGLDFIYINPPDILKQISKTVLSENKDINKKKWKPIRKELR
jgi:CO dehydrogenase/acetyl-CoA synthase epsilon subunit